jgi:hypothetical protein
MSWNEHRCPFQSYVIRLLVLAANVLITPNAFCMSLIAVKHNEKLSVKGRIFAVCGEYI